MWLSSSTLPVFPPGSLSATVFSFLFPQTISHSWQQSLPWDRSPTPSSQLLRAPVDSRPCLGYAGLQHRLWGSHSTQIVTDPPLHAPAAANASPSSQLTAPVWRSHRCFSSPNPCVQVRSAHSSLSSFLPSSYQVLCESIDSFLVVRDSCQFSAGALGGLLHLKMHSWSIHEHRYTTHPPTSPPSCFFSPYFSWLCIFPFALSYVAKLWISCIFQPVGWVFWFWWCLCHDELNNSPSCSSHLNPWNLGMLLFEIVTLQI